MTAPLVGSTSDSTPAAKTIRTSVLIHPVFDQNIEGKDVTFLLLPHPRTHIPTYFLSTTGPDGQDQLLELSSLTDSKLDRSCFIGSSRSSPQSASESTLEQVISKARLEILSAIDVRFLIISILDTLTTGPASDEGADAGVFRSAEDAFEQAAAQIYRARKDGFISRVAAFKADNASNGTAAQNGEEEDEEWTDIVTFANLPIVQRALRQVADVQELSENGSDSNTVYRLSRSKAYADVLAPKLASLSRRSTFVQSPNVLAHSFLRRWPHASDPTIHVIASDGATPDAEPEAGSQAFAAAQLRRQIAAEIIASYLPPALSLDWFRHLQLPSE